MPDFEYLDLYAKFAGFRIIALANRLSCDDGFSRRAHDKLVVELDELIRVTRRILAAEHALASDPDANQEDLGETIWCAEQNLTCVNDRGIGTPYFRAKGTPVEVMKGMPVSARSGEAGRGCTA